MVTFIIQQFTVIGNIHTAEEELIAIKAKEDEGTATEEDLAAKSGLESHVKFKGSCLELA